MKIRLTVMLLVVAALLPSTASGQAKGDRQKINDGEFARQVNSAIDKGVAWLRKQQRADGSWADRKGFEGGQTALSLLALSASGVHADDPVMKKGFEHLLQQPLSKTYVVAVTVMALESAYGHRDPAKYFRRPKAMPKAVAQKMFTAVRWLVGKYNPAQNGWRYPEGGADHSHNQIVLLGLKAACRSGMGQLVPIEIWHKLLTRMLDRQSTRGPLVQRLGARKGGRQGSVESPYRGTRAGVPARGWDYGAPGAEGKVSGSMTTAGIATVALCRSELLRRRYRRYDRSLDQRVRRSLEGGLAWLAHHWAVEKNPGEDGWHYYYLYGLERVGVFLDLYRIGTHAWYREGALYLIRNQTREGDWDDEERSAFALLFLKRASVPIITGLGKKPRARHGVRDNKAGGALENRPKLGGVVGQGKKPAETPKTPKKTPADPKDKKAGKDQPPPEGAGDAGRSVTNVRPKQGGRSVTPPYIPFLGQRINRWKIVFVLDKSSSMRGLMPKLLAELARAVGQLPPRHRFTLIFFDGQNRSLSNKLLAGTERNKKVALAFAERQDARGATDPLPALKGALTTYPEVEAIVFLTDGRLSEKVYLFMRGFLQKVTARTMRGRKKAKLYLVLLSQPDTKLDPWHHKRLNDLRPLIARQEH